MGSDGHRQPSPEGKPCLCAVKDVDSDRIVGYSIDSFSEVPPGEDKPPAASATPTADRAFAPGSLVPALHGSDMVGSMGRAGPAGDKPRWADRPPPRTRPA